MDSPNDYIGLYLDSEPEENVLPASVHMLDGRTNGQVTTDYYLPRIDYYNETNDISRHRSEEIDSLHSYTNAEPTRQQSASVRSLGGDVRWRRYGELDVHRQSHSRPNVLMEECIGYCIAYHSRNKILAKNCLKTNPTWMFDSFAWFGARSLPSLMLPGTHNSGTYPHQLDKTVLQMINKYQINQDESIFNQLVYGIRYLDLRVGYSKVKNNPETLWIYHDIFRTDVSLSDVLDQVSRFLDLTSHEIVIIDFHRFTVGFQNENILVQQERHKRVLDLLFRKLSGYIIPSYLGQHAHLSEYISIGKRLIIGYADRNIILNSLGEQPSHISFYKDQGKRHPEPSNNRYKLQWNSSDEDSFITLPNEATDKRMGTRLYDKLKSLRVIRHSFSKRSVIPPKFWNDTDKSVKEKPHMEVSQSQQLSHLVQSNEPQSFTSKLSILFSPVRHLWPNKDTVEGLAQYMNETTCRKYFDELRSLMVELTPTVFGVIADKYDGNRKLAQLVNRHVTDWIRDRWLHCVNIVASDFFLGNYLTRLAIDSNKMRASDGRLELNLHTGCKSFRRIESLLDKSKIPIQFTYQVPITRGFNDVGKSGFKGGGGVNIVTHVGTNGDKIFLKPLTRTQYAHHKPQSREMKESFVDSISDGLSDLFSSFKRILSL